MPIPTAPTPAVPYTGLDKHIAKNASWATSFELDQPGLFEKLSQGQSPQILWFGCSDSRVPETLALASHSPGEIFVHRNIANTFRQADDSCHSVLEYGVGHLGIKHVVVVGHTACGGCAAAFKCDPPQAGRASLAPSFIEGTEGSPLMNFLQPLIELRHSLPKGATLDDLIKANIKKGVEEICQTEVIQKQWDDAIGFDAGRRTVQVHGWLYDLPTGRLSDLDMTRSALVRRAL